MPIRKETIYLVKDVKNGKICFAIALCWVKLKTKVLPKYGIRLRFLLWIGPLFW
jgi:hypothetical protein